MTEPRARALPAPAAYALLAALALALFVPRLGAYGFWDPYEIRIADAARAVAQAGPEQSSAALVRAAESLHRPPFTVALIASGFRHVGVGELGGRLPIALVALFAVLACFYAGSGLIRGRGALLGAFVLATTPAFLLGARQLTTNAPLLLATALAVGGLSRALWADRETPLGIAAGHAVLGAIGLTLGQLSAGVLVGVVAPVGTVALALVAAAPAGPRRLAGAALAVVTVLLVAVAGWTWAHTNAWSSLLGGQPHPFTSSVVFTGALKQLGFGLFPWIALLPMAVLHALASTTSDDEPEPRAWFGRIVLVAWFVMLYVTSSLQAAGAQELLMPAAPAALLLVAAWIDDLLDSAELQPFAALTAALGAIVVGHDFFVFPEQYVGVHMLETIRWPGPMTAFPYVIMVYAVVFAVVVAAALGVPLGGAGSTEEQRRRNRTRLVGAAVATSLVMALATAHWLIPACSKHLSARDLYGKSKQLDPNAPVGQYRFNASGAAYYSGGKTPTTLNTIDSLFQFLGRGERVFVMAGTEELPSIDQYAKQQSKTYYLVDDSSSRFLMLSNRLGPGERDLNPLRLFVSSTPPPIAHKLDINFGDKVQLIGWDVPDEVGKGQDIRLRLYFKVLAPIPGSYRVFVHIDGAGTRVNGDHSPLEGRFATNYWVPGFYITDEHLIRPDRNTENSGSYLVYAGLYMGAERMKVLAGPSDGDNRARLGELKVR